MNNNDPGNPENSQAQRAAGLSSSAVPRSPRHVLRWPRPPSTHPPAAAALSAELRCCQHGPRAHSPRHTQLPGGTVTRRQYSCSHQKKKKIIKRTVTLSVGQRDKGTKNFPKGKPTRGHRRTRASVSEHWAQAAAGWYLLGGMMSPLNVTALWLSLAPTHPPASLRL